MALCQNPGMYGFWFYEGHDRVANRFPILRAENRLQVYRYRATTISEPSKWAEPRA
jgi:hypothetical protein